MRGAEKERKKKKEKKRKKRGAEMEKNIATIQIVVQNHFFFYDVYTRTIKLSQIRNYKVSLVVLLAVAQLRC